MDDARTLVAEHHGRFYDIIADRSVLPVVDITAADTGEFYSDDYVVGRRDLGNWAVFVGDVIGFLQDEGGVLCVLVGVNEIGLWQLASFDMMNDLRSKSNRVNNSRKSQ